MTIRLEEEIAHKRGKVFNWQTATYGKIRVDDDLHNLSSVEAEFPAIVINDAFASQDTFQCKYQNKAWHRAWRRMFDIRGPLVHELILEFFSTFRFGQSILDLDTLGTLQFQLGGARRRISWRQFILALGLHTEEEMQTAGFGVYKTGSTRQIPDKGFDWHVALLGGGQISVELVILGPGVDMGPECSGCSAGAMLKYQDKNAPVFPIFYIGHREGNIDEYWWIIYKSGNLFSVGVLKLQEGCSTYDLAHKRKVQKSTEPNISEFSFYSFLNYCI
ncbi:hypothetical protein Tco_0519837 [Tanacetum coccineum]